MEKDKMFYNIMVYQSKNIVLQHKNLKKIKELGLLHLHYDEKLKYYILS